MKGLTSLIITVRARVVELVGVRVQHVDPRFNWVNQVDIVRYERENVGYIRLVQASASDVTVTKYDDARKITAISSRPQTDATTVKQ